MEPLPRRKLGLVGYLLTAGVIALAAINLGEYIFTINKLARIEQTKGIEYSVKEANRLYSKIDRWQEYLIGSGIKLAAKSYLSETLKP
jgi:hypothetical protein